MKDYPIHPAVGVIFENKNGSKFEVVGFEWDFPKNGVRESKKILKQLFKNGTHGEKAFLFTDEELIEQMRKQTIWPVQK